MSSHSLDWDPISPTPKSACEVSFSGENVVTLEKGRVGFQRDFQGWHEIFVFNVGLQLQRHIGFFSCLH